MPSITRPAPISHAKPPNAVLTATTATAAPSTHSSSRRVSIRLTTRNGTSARVSTERRPLSRSIGARVRRAADDDPAHRRHGERQQRQRQRARRGDRLARARALERHPGGGDPQQHLVRAHGQRRQRLVVAGRVAAEEAGRVGLEHRDRDDGDRRRRLRDEGQRDRRHQQARQHQRQRARLRGEQREDPAEERRQRGRPQREHRAGRPRRHCPISASSRSTLG